jgi:membrane fusion protein (multidrug efflux system)
MANPRRLLGIAVPVLFVIGVVAYLGITKGNTAAIDSTAADSTTGKTPEFVRPGDEPRTFDAGIALPVMGAPVERAPLIIWVRGLGEAVSSHQVVVSAEAPGRVTKVYRKEFDLVRAGDTLIVVDTTELVFALRQARNSLAQAQHTYRNELISDSLIPDPAIRAERQANARMRSGLVNAELALERAELEYAKAATLAPISGRIANVKVATGQRVAGAEIMSIFAMNPIRVNVQVLQSDLAKVRVGNRARMLFPSIPDTVYGVVEQINPLIETNTRTARVTVRVENPTGQIFPGMTANVQLQSITYPDKLLVPQSAILQRSDGRDMLFVYNPHPDGKEGGLTEWRYVAIGLRNEEFVEIIPGVDGSQKMVEPGEIVLIAGHYTIEHQTNVKLVDRLSAITRR